MTHISEITLLIAVIALALWPVVLFALRFLRERQKRLEYIERMTKDEQDEVTTKDLVISVLKKIGCQPKVNEENHITFKYQGDDFYIAAEEENRFIMIWNPWWGSINADNEALPYLKEIINLANVNSLVTTVYMVDEDEKTIGLHSRCHTFFSPREGELEEHMKMLPMLPDGRQPPLRICRPTPERYEREPPGATGILLYPPSSQPVTLRSRAQCHSILSIRLSRAACSPMMVITRRSASAACMTATPFSPNAKL